MSTDIAADDEDDDEKKEGKEGEKEGEGDKEEDTYNYKDLIRRDERRWKKADQDGDGSLSKDEYKDFLHPEDVPHMRDIVVDVSVATTPGPTARPWGPQPCPEAHSPTLGTTAPPWGPQPHPRDHMRDIVVDVG